MERAIALRRLRSISVDIKRLGAKSLYLFGSTARNEATACSDIDLFIDVAHPKKFSLI